LNDTAAGPGSATIEVTPGPMPEIAAGIEAFNSPSRQLRPTVAILRAVAVIALAFPARADRRR